MKLALKLTVLALVGAAAGVQAQELRGPAVLADVAVSGAEDANKRSAAQKRATQRSERRRREGRTRSASEERAERDRKARQASRSGRGNPYDRSDRRNSRRWIDDEDRRARRKHGSDRRWDRDSGRRRRDRSRNRSRDRYNCRCRNSNRRDCLCEGFENQEDADLVAAFLEDYGEDADVIADFLFDALDYSSED